MRLKRAAGTDRRSAFRRGDAGMTLTEVLIVVVVLGIIIVPLGNVIIGIVRITDTNTKLLSESHDVQIMSAYFSYDVQNLGTRDWSAYPYPLLPSVERGKGPAEGAYPCGAAGLPTAVLRLAWDDPQPTAGAPRQLRAAYVVMSAGGENQLHRVLCAGTDPPVDTVLAHNVTGVDEPRCFDKSRATQDCTITPVPARVELTVHIRHPSGTGAPVDIVLSGQRRQS